MLHTTHDPSQKTEGGVGELEREEVRVQTGTFRRGQREAKEGIG